MADEVQDAIPVEVDEAVPQAAVPATMREIVEGRRGFDAESALAEFEYRETLTKRLRDAALKTLRPCDFIIQGGEEDSVAYLQDSGAQRLKSLLGTVYPLDEPPKSRREDLADGEFAYVYEGFIGSRTMKAFDFVVGGRSSSERFFDKFDDDGNRLPVMALDVRKAAFTNWECRALSGLAGLRGLTKAELKEMKFPADKCKSIEYGAGKGGGAGGGKSAANYVPFGDEKGKPWKEASADTLRFHRSVVVKALDDPEKAKWKRSNQSRLDAINAEIQRRRDDAGSGDGK